MNAAACVSAVTDQRTTLVGGAARPRLAPIILGSGNVLVREARTKDGKGNGKGRRGSPDRDVTE